MKIHLISYGITLLSLLVLDGIWLALIMSKIYQRNLSHLMALSVTWWPVVIFYLFYAGGMVFFVVRPALLRDLSLWWVFGSGFLLGLIAYSAYDLTNQATLRHWPVFITVIDIAWGGVVTAVSSLIGVWGSKMVAKIM